MEAGCFRIAVLHLLVGPCQVPDQKSAESVSQQDASMGPPCSCKTCVPPQSPPLPWTQSPTKKWARFPTLLAKILQSCKSC